MPTRPRTATAAPNRIIRAAADPQPSKEDELVVAQGALDTGRRMAEAARVRRNQIILDLHRNHGYPPVRIRDVLNAAGAGLTADAIEKVLKRA